MDELELDPAQMRGVALLQSALQATAESLAQKVVQLGDNPLPFIDTNEDIALTTLDRLERSGDIDAHAADLSRRLIRVAFDTLRRPFKN